MFKISFCLPSSLSLRLRADASGLRLLLVERKFVQSDLGGLLACTDLKIIDFHWISLHFCVFQLKSLRCCADASGVFFLLVECLKLVFVSPPR